jgi:hypothetical protein
MVIIEHHIERGDMVARCAKWMQPMQVAEACAEWSFQTKECHIWYGTEFPLWFVRDHERMHCNGWMHD